MEWKWSGKQESIAQWVKENCEKKSLIVIDDLQNQLAVQKDATLLCTALANHKECVIVITLQVVFLHNSTSIRSLLRDSDLLLFIKAPRQRGSLRHLSIQLSLKDALPRAYDLLSWREILCIDFSHSQLDHLRLRTLHRQPEDVRCFVPNESV